MTNRGRTFTLAGALAAGGALATALLAGDPAPPQVSVADVNPGTSVERDLCLSVSLAPGAASECGDLRLAHALPAVRTLGRARAPVLLYNSQHASPHPIVAAHVTLPDGPSGLSRVVATLKVNGTPRGQGVWKGSAWPGSGPVRIAVGYDAASDSTGPYRYTLEVRAHYGETTLSTTAAGELVVVNRRESVFGAGWWLAGLERLVMDPFGKPVLWVGGDGSTRRYTKAGAGDVWGAPSLDQPDTLKREANGWVRVLSGGGRVHFDLHGRHVATTNRLGHSTEFWYNQAGRLDSIAVPPTAPREAGVALPVPKRLIPPYAFVYGEDGRLSGVVAPAFGTARITSVHRSGARVDSIADPDDTRVRFGYESASSLRVSSRTDRRKQRTDFRYDPGFRVAASKLWMDTLATGDTVLSLLRAAESLGLAASGLGAVALADVYAQVDGPRVDVQDRARFWTDRWGAPQQIVNALNDTTQLTRGDLRFPALVTRMRSANGRVTGAEYDARGNVLATTDSSHSRVEPNGATRYATTRYEWDSRWDVVTKITLPVGEVTTFGYDQDTGNRVWQQVGTDPARRVTFAYETEGIAKGMIATSIAPGAQRPDSVAYDRLGNLALVVSPKGSRVEYRSDALGRDSVTLVPLGGSLEQRRTVTYIPGTDLVERTATYGPAMNGRGTQTLWVRSEYDAEGNPTLIERWSDPDPSAARIGRIRTSWRYDAAGRAVAELAPGSGTFTETLYRDECTGTNEVDGCTRVPYDTTYTIEHKDSTLYDRAGNPVEVHTRRTDPATGAPLVIRMKYDALNRLEERVVPQVHYSRARDQGIPRYFRKASTAHCADTIPERTYPSRPNDGGCGYRIEEDVQTFRYDRMGNVTRADNREAQVRRRYNLNGTLQVDSLRIRSSEGTDFSRHEYGLEFQYDLNGRRTELHHPSQLAPSPAQTKVSYGYDPITGALDRVTDPLGNVFRYEYNVRGELHRKVFVGAAWDEYDYEADGALTGYSTFRLEEQVPGENFRRFEYLRRTDLTRDAQGRLKQASNTVGRRDTITSKYSGLGHLVGTTASIYGDTTSSPTFRGNEGFAYDALGNVANDTAFQSVKTAHFRKETRSERTSGYIEGTGRLSWISGTVTQHLVAPLQPTIAVSRREAFEYDASGNLEFSTQSYRSSGSCSSQSKDDADCEDRVSFYAADGTLRAAEHRVRMGEDNKGYWRDAFEEYRYDALGRRVWVRSHVACPEGIPTDPFPFVPCYGAVRRTVWDGNAELWEIQMPGEVGSPYLENDTADVPVRPYSSWVPTPTSSTTSSPAPENYSRFDPNPRYGRVAYTHGLGVDQPLSLVRIGLSRYYPGDPFRNTAGQGVTFAPFAAIPLSDWRGHVDGAVYAGGAKQHCQTFSGTARCTSVVMGQAWSAYGHEDSSLLEWHGTLPTGKRDATGTLFRRARYYDAQTGRFTQEDPIGLAGGLNLYGYADGDPTNFSDPSGLCPWCIGALIGGAAGAGMYYLTTPPGQRTWQGALQYTLGGAVVGGTMGYGLGLVAAADAAAGGTAVVRGTGFVGELTVKAYYPAAGATAVATGKAGEKAVHQLVDIGQKVTIQVGGRVRIPDGLTATVLSEVKNVKNLSFTSQLRDFLTYAQANDLRFDLWVTPSTRLSGPLQRAIARGEINLRIFEP